MPLVQVQQALLTGFKTVGMPRYIKVDNGRPFADPQREIIPTLALWLVALGIQIIFNRPRTPQDNAKVERAQGVLSKWTEWNKCADYFTLQVRLWEQTDCHNTQYRSARLQHKTRAEVFKNLLQSPRPLLLHQFNPQLAIDFVAKGSWEREVSKQGQCSFWGQRWQAGLKYAHQRISIKLNPKNNHWEVFDKNGTLIKTFHSNITQQSLWKLDLS